MVYGIRDRLSVYLFQDDARHDLRIRLVQGSAGNHLRNPQPVSRIAVIIEDPQAGGPVCCRWSMSDIAGACMRGIQLSQHLTQHLRKIIVVIDRG